MKKELKVPLIRNGTVIDHINSGNALKVLHILGIPEKSSSIVSVVMNVKSKLGKKDIVKVENRELDPKEVDKIALIAPKATINIIRVFQVYYHERIHPYNHTYIKPFISGVFASFLAKIFLQKLNTTINPILLLAFFLLYILIYAALLVFLKLDQYDRFILEKLKIFLKIWRKGIDSLSGREINGQESHPVGFGCKWGGILC